jgi:hypothetical protein
MGLDNRDYMANDDPKNYNPAKCPKTGQLLYQDRNDLLKEIYEI